MSSGHLLYRTYSTTEESTSSHVSALLHGFNDHCRVKHAYELDIKEEASGCQVNKNSLFALRLLSLENLSCPAHVTSPETTYGTVKSPL